jgi:hypothetical protein
VELFAQLSMVAIDLDDVLAAIDFHRLHQVSFWDALVIRSALRAGCSRLYSEDLRRDGESTAWRSSIPSSDRLSGGPLPAGRVRVRDLPLRRAKRRTQARVTPPPQAVGERPPR